MANIETTTATPPDPNGHQHQVTQPTNGNPTGQVAGTWDPAKNAFIIQAPTSTPVAQNEPPRPVFSADDIERARSEERSKLHTDLEAMRNELKRLGEAESARQAAAADVERLQREVEERKRVDETDAKTLITQKEQEWATKFQTLEQEIAARDAMMEKERELGALESFKAQALLEHGDDIMPQLRDFVRGNTPDEVMASIEAMKTRTAEILGSVQEAFAGPQGVPFQQPSYRTPQPTGAPAFDPSALTGGQRTITDAEIRNMTLEEYAKVRNDLHAASRNFVQRHGPYGNR